MKDIDKKIFEYIKNGGKGDKKEITIPFLDSFLIMKYKEKEYIGGKLIAQINSLVNDNYLIKTTGSKVALSQKGIEYVKTLNP